MTVSVSTKASLQIVFVLDTNMELPSLSRAVSQAQVRQAFQLRAFTRDDLFDSSQIERCVEAIAHSDAVVFIAHGGATSIPGWPQMIATAKNRYCHVQPTPGCDSEVEIALTHSTLSRNAGFSRRCRYLRFGGVDNLVAFMLQICSDCGRDCGSIPEPQPLPQHGIYHPFWRPEFNSEKALANSIDSKSYLDWARVSRKLSADAPVIGFWFYQSHWVNRDFTFVDAVIQSIESRGAIPLAVFHNRFPDPELDHGGAPEVVDRYFLRDGSPIIEALLSPVAFSLSVYGHQGCYSRLGVPVLQMISSSTSRAAWEASDQGVNTMDVATSAAQPEFDGCLITTIAASREVGRQDTVTGATLTIQEPIPERIGRCVDLALNWAKLRRTQASKRRVAILFHHIPARADRLGCASGLDSFESVNELLRRLRTEGYQVEPYESGEALAHELVGRLTNDRRWLSPAAQAECAAACIEADTVRQWFDDLPDFNRQSIMKAWGNPPGPVFSHQGQLLIGGMVNHNIFIGVQPPRGFIDKLEGPDPSHDPDLPFPFHYPAYYQWLRETFQAQAVIHVGTHGTLEWLPGKSLGLSQTCSPDLAIADLPNIYPYIVNNPGEGTQAKRRSAACIIDHLCQPQMAADLAPEWVALIDLLTEIFRARAENPGKLPLLAEQLWQAVCAGHLDSDLGAEWNRDRVLAELPAFCERLHGYLHQIRDSSVNNGLHVLGRVKQGAELRNMLLYSTRLPFANQPSLWDLAARLRGLNPEDLRDRPGSRCLSHEKSFGDLRREILDDLLLKFERLDARGWCDNAIAEEKAPLHGILRAVRDIIRTPLSRTHNEIDACCTALAGRFVEPGAAGCLTRGDCELLPTGRNLCSLDPFKVPSRQAWEVGVRLGDALIERYRGDHHQALPKNIGIVIWATPTMTTRGDDVAEVLYLMGVRPVWHPSSGRVLGLEVIPSAERKIPRFDVTIRISSLFRDAFPNLLDLIDQGVRMIAALEEPDESNILAANVRAEVRSLQAQGIDYVTAQRKATLRLFGEKPGTHGVGMDHILETGKWERTEELGSTWVDWGSYSYGQDLYGKRERNALCDRLRRLNCTVKNMDSREHDILSMDDVMLYQGGMNAAVQYAGGNAASYIGDSSDPCRICMRSTAEEARFIFRTRLLNPKWVAGMKRHGFKGAGDISQNIHHCMQWDATSGILEDWQYEELARAYALNPAMQGFLRQHNPDAWHNIAERLLEAIVRGLWECPGDELREQLQDALLQAEGCIEERHAPNSVLTHLPTEATR